MNRLLTTQVRGIIEKDRSAEFIISSERKDRHKTVILIDKWHLDSYNKNPIVGYQHDVYGDNWFQRPDPDSVIGKSEVYKDEVKKLLIAYVTFEPADINPLAEKIWQKILHGSLKAASVGFLPLKKPAGKWGVREEAETGSNPTFYYEDVELLEWSIVNIPSNPDATVLRSLEVLEPYSTLKRIPDSKNIDLLRFRLACAIHGTDIRPTDEQKINEMRMKIKFLEAGINPKTLKPL